MTNHNPDNPNNNPRIARAFAHAANKRAKDFPTEENIDAALEHAERMAQGPKKSKALAEHALGIAGVGDKSHVAFVDWTRISETTGAGNIGGKIIPKELADRFAEEHKQNLGKEEKDQIFHARDEVITTAGALWVAGTDGSQGIRHLDVLPLDVARGLPEVTHDWNGSPQTVEPHLTASSAIVATARQSYEQKNSRER